MEWIYLLIAISAEVTATSTLKLTEGFTKLAPSIVVGAGYIVSFFFLSLTLKHFSVGITYAIWSGVGIVFVSIIAYFFYKQNLDLPAMIGIGLIIIGIAVINLFSKSIAH
jgi:small multidrug resistance pump